MDARLHPRPIRISARNNLLSDIISPMKAPKQDYSQTLNKVDDDEKLLAIIKRHPFGIIKLYFQVFIALSVAGGLIYYLLPDLVSRDDNPGLYAIIGLLAVVVFGFMMLITGIATILYNKNQLVITDKTITQTLQVSLFDKKTSQLSVSSVEDVTANNNGFFPTIFGYGRLLIETAGEQENFHFDYCPHAEHYAKLVLEARQEFMGSRELELRDSAKSYATSRSSRKNDGLLVGQVAVDAEETTR